MYFEILLYAALFFATIPVWIFLYKHYLGGILADIYVSKIESGQIDLNYLLEEGGVFDNLTEKIVVRFKQNLLADLGQMANQSKTNIDSSSTGPNYDPMAMGLETAGELLKAVGMRKPPAMLQYKVAAALGNMLDNQNKDDSGEFSSFYPDRP